MRRRFATGVLFLISSLPAPAADEDKWSTVKGKVVFDDSKHKIPVRGAPKVPNAVAAGLHRQRQGIPDGRVDCRCKNKKE